MDIFSNQLLCNKNDKCKHLREKLSPVLEFVAKAPPYWPSLACDIMRVVHWAGLMPYSTHTVETIKDIETDNN